MADKDILADAKEGFRLAVEHEADNRINGLDDIRFARLGEQWPLNIRQQRELEHRPVLTINRLPAFIRQVVNDTRQNSPSLVVHPVDSQADPKTAKIINGLIRNIEAVSSADQAYDTALESAVTNGWGYFKINTAYCEDDSFDQDICIERVANPFSIYGDPHSFAADSADWNSAFEVDWLTKDAFKRQYKGAEEVNWDALGYSGLEQEWIDEERVLVASWWVREPVKRNILLLSSGEIVGEDIYAEHKAEFDAAGVQVVGQPREVSSHKVTQRLLTGAEVLKTVNWPGKYIPIVPVYGEDINIEGKRHLRSFVRDAKDPQRMFNYWRTASTELVALAPKAPYIGKKGAFATDYDKWVTANSETHAFIEYDGAEAPERQPFAGPAGGAIAEAMNASDDIKSILGMFDASLGAKSNETSGKAILARQREGDVGTFHFSDNLSRAIRHAGRVIIDLIPYVYNAPRIIRTVGVDGTPQNVPVNGAQPPPPQAPSGPSVASPQPQPGMEPQQGQAPPPLDGQAADILPLYDLTVGKYDVTVETGPSYTTQREEAANQMMELLRVFPEAAPVIGDLVAKNLDWPGADEIAQRLQALQQHMLNQPAKGAPPATPAPPPDPVEIEKLNQEAQKTQADTALRSRQLDIEQFEAETDRMRAMREAQEPIMQPVQRVA